MLTLLQPSPGSGESCGGALGGRGSQYLTGDFLRDRKDCLGPGGEPYPSQYIRNMVRRERGRTGRTLSTSTMGRL